MPRRRGRKLPPNTKAASPVQPNAGVAAAYRRKLLSLIEGMHKAALSTVQEAWRTNTPELAQDKGPSASINKQILKQFKRWRGKFDADAEVLAQWFAGQTDLHTSNALRKSMMESIGMTVKFKPSRAVLDVLDSIVAENVGLIRSIPEQYFTDIQGEVMRSVQTGRDLESLTQGLQERFGVTQSRAELIARDQSNKATESINRTRQQDLGITQAVWVHSGGGKHPRESHVHADGKVYDLAKGCLVDGEYIFPGQLINCRCVSSPVIAAFDN